MRNAGPEGQRPMSNSMSNPSQRPIPPEEAARRSAERADPPLRSGTSRPAGLVPGATDERFLSEAGATALAKRLIAMAQGGGTTQMLLDSSWTGNIHWARNQIDTCGDVRNNSVTPQRTINGASSGNTVHLNMIDDVALEAAVRRAERFLQLKPEDLTASLDVEYTEQHLNPIIWSEATYNLEAEPRAAVVRQLIAQVEQAGLVAAGYLEVAAHGTAIMSSRGRAMYYPYTAAEYTVTVRDSKGTGSGWAGLSHWDWGKLDTQALTQKAIEKCLASRNPVALEPGRYTTILEPQAAYQVVGPLFENGVLDRGNAEAENENPPYWKAPYLSKLGEVVMDERLTAETDPMDPELGQLPFAQNQRWLEVYYPAQWIKNGVLTDLAYHREYAVTQLGKSHGLPASGSFRLRSSVTVSMTEMIATTKRGLLVSRCYGGRGSAFFIEAYTRDGLWLIEDGKISKPVKNFWFEEQRLPLVQPARLEQVGVPVRVYAPGCSVMMPPLKVKDFNFTLMADAI